MSAEEPLLPLIPGTNGTANPLTNAVQSALDRMIGRRGAALNYGYTYPQSWIFWPEDGSSAFNGVAIQGSNAASSVLNVNGKILAIDATGAQLQGGTNWTSSTLGGNVGIPFDNTPAILSGPGKNTYLPTTWYLVIGHHAYDTSSEEMFELTACDSNTARVTFANTNQLGNLFTANVYSGTNDIVGRPGSIIGYSYAAPRHLRVLPYADHRSFCTGTIASVPAVTNAAGVTILPAGPAPGIIRTDGLRLDFAQCRGNQFRCYDSAGVYHAATVNATSTAQVIYLSSTNFTPVAGSATWCGPATARATAGKDEGNALEFYRGYTIPYLGLDLDDSYGSPLKPAQNYGVLTAEPDGMGGTACPIENVPNGVFDIDYNTTNGLENIDDSVTICEREVDHFIAKRFYSTFRGKQIRIRNLAGGGWVENKDYTGASAIPVIGFAKIDQIASGLFASFGLTNTINVQQGTCVGLTTTNSTDSQIRVSGITPPYTPVRCDLEGVLRDGSHLKSRALFVGSNTVNLADGNLWAGGTGLTQIDGTTLICTFGESSVEANQVRSPWVDSACIIPDADADGVLPLSYSSVGSVSFLQKSQSLISRRREVLDYSVPQGFADENGDAINAFTNRTLAVFAGSNFFQPGVRDAGNFYPDGTGFADTYYGRHHIGQISPENPDHQSIRDGLRSGTVCAAGSFFIQTNKQPYTDPVWGGVGKTLTGTVASSTGTSVTLAPGTSETFFWPAMQTMLAAHGRGVDLRVDTGTGTNAGTLPYQFDRVCSGVASSGANLTISFTNAAGVSLTGGALTLTVPWKPSLWAGYPLTITPASGAPQFQVTATANTNGWFFFPATTNTINVGDRWAVGYRADGNDMLRTGGVIQCDASGTPGSWEFKTGGADALRLFVKSPQDFLPDPRSNLEGFRKLHGPCVPGSANLIEMHDEATMRLLAMQAYLGPDPQFDDNGGSNRVAAAIIGSDGAGPDLGSTNTLSMMLAAADSFAAGGSAAPWHANGGPPSIDTNDAPPQATVGISYGIQGDNPSLLTLNNGAGFNTTVSRVSVPDTATLRGLPVQSKVYLYFQMNAANDDQVTSYSSPTDPVGGCGGGTLQLFAPPYGVAGAGFRQYALVGSAGGATSVGGIAGVVGSLTHGPWPSSASTTIYETIYDAFFNPIACGTNVVATSVVGVQASYYSPGGKTVCVPSYSAAASTGF